MHKFMTIIRGCHGRRLLKTTPKLHHEELRMPMDNMPFTVPNRYILTGVFCVLFGVGWWTPWGILWYSMAKRTF